MQNRIRFHAGPSWRWATALIAPAALVLLICGEIAYAPAGPPALERLSQSWLQAQPEPASAPAERLFAKPSTLSRLLERPLFEPTRRPPAQAAATDDRLPPQPPPRLTGTLVGSSTAIAFLSFADRDRPVAAATGDHFGPYRVAEIVPGQVTLDGPAGRVTLSLTADAKQREASVAELPRSAPRRAKPRGLPNGAMPGSAI